MPDSARTGTAGTASLRYAADAMFVGLGKVTVTPLL